MQNDKKTEIDQDTLTTICVLCEIINEDHDENGLEREIERLRLIFQD